ncbi:MAG: tetratricopeptide repeat protein [Candidatus Latescibacterota bacterium]
MMEKIQCLALAFLLAFPGTLWADKAASFNRKGIQAYKEKKFEESVQQFTEALIERPDAPELKFNRGTGLSGLGKKDEAITELNAAAGIFNRPEQSAAAYFNAGNTLLAAEDIEGAIEQYRRAVKLDQGSKDIRHNLELALRKLNDQKKDQSPKENDKKDDQKKDQQKNQSPNQNNQQQNKEQQQSRQQDSDLRPMTKEEAERLLNAINDEEKKSLSLRNQQIKNRVQEGDDW